MRISHFPIVAIERVLGAGLLPAMLERAMKACVTRSLPDVWLDFVHIMESWNMTASSAQHVTRTPTLLLQRRRCRSAIRAAKSRAGSDNPDLARQPEPGLLSSANNLIVCAKRLRGVEQTANGSGNGG
jgi:hypothetical protein